MENMLETALFLPLAGFLFLLIGSAWIAPRRAGWIASAVIFLSFLCFSALLFAHVEEGATAPLHFLLFKWIQVRGIEVEMALQLDSLSLLMALIISGIGFLIHLYSIGYMEGEEGAVRYFAYLNFFIFAMLLLVLAANLALLFVGWEGVGLASYLLIGFWHQRKAAAAAATKAFVVNRIGDVGLLLGLLLTFQLFGTSDIAGLEQQTKMGFSGDASLLGWLTLLYFIGAVGKSAQLPLHVWLPDAMEGPTPVSALIHAATMVTAGVYLVVRLHFLFLLSPAILHLVGLIGGVTSLFAALCAMGQTDLKRVLAYSTISQLGLMFLACGVGAFYAAMFHLTMHAFAKGLLFLAAGNVVHGMGGLTDMRQMGGLGKVFPVTQGFFLVGVLALSGIPPLGAFFSKELILEQEHLAGFDLLFTVGLLTSILTAFYLTRAFCLTFRGSVKSTHMGHEAPSGMLIPLGFLAFGSIFGGFLGFALGSTPFLEQFLAEVGVSLAEPEPSGGIFWIPETWIAMAGGVAGLALSWLLYTRFADQIKPQPILKNGFFFDTIYQRILVNPLKALAGWTVRFGEQKIIQAPLYATARSVEKIAQTLQRIQNGQIRAYAAWIILGSVFLLYKLSF